MPPSKSRATLIGLRLIAVLLWSAALVAALQYAPLSFAFWTGASMVVMGAILCWLATRGKRARA